MTKRFALPCALLALGALWTFAGCTPHLSIGQVGRRAGLAKLVEDLQQTWSPLDFRVEEVCLIRRGDPPKDVFRVEHRIRLGAQEAPRTGRTSAGGPAIAGPFD